MQTVAFIRGSRYLECLVSGSDEQKLLLRGLAGVSGLSGLVPVRVVFSGQLAVRATDLRFTGLTRNPKHVIATLSPAIQSLDERGDRRKPQNKHKTDP